MEQNSSEDTNAPSHSFSEFIYIEAQKGGLYLGQLPNPMTGEKEVNLRAAEHVIGNLTMLQEKTQGNLTTQEEELLGKALENLSGLYETVKDLH